MPWNDYWNNAKDRSSLGTLPECVQCAWNSVWNSPNMYSNYYKHLERFMKWLERSLKRFERSLQLY